MSDTPEETFWVTGMLPNDQVWMTACLWIVLAGFTIMLAGQALALFDMWTNIKAQSGIIQVPEYEKLEWAEETKYYVTEGVTEDAPNKNDQTHAGLLTNELPSNI